MQYLKTHLGQCLRYVMRFMLFMVACIAAALVMIILAGIFGCSERETIFPMGMCFGAISAKGYDMLDGLHDPNRNLFLEELRIATKLGLIGVGTGFVSMLVVKFL